MKEADWKEQYAIAKKQCLVGVLFDGIKKLPAEHVGMKKELLLQWMAESQMLEKANVRLNDAAIQISEWFGKNRTGSHTGICSYGNNYGNLWCAEYGRRFCKAYP